MPDADMTDDRWQHISRIYKEAVDLSPGDRDVFLRRACGTDHALYAEVEALLVEVGREVAKMSAPQRIGTHIGAYEIQALLGVGGMGEVYRARDTKLGRDVAIKILPPAFASDVDRLARFEREARALASLNHRNIGAIYGFETTSGMPALVLELVEGETLAQRLTKHPMPMTDALRIGVQIADALEAAHEHGIIHRDLKPANVMMTRDGSIKVLDFSLAKACVPKGASADRDTVNTREGLILGTAAYMSPEQARGQAVDQRTDIWAFGCVLYEMLAGKCVFAGEDVTDTLARILEREPDWGALPEAVSTEIRRLLKRCLAKDPKSRLRDMGDARLDIEDALLYPTENAASRVISASDVQRSLLRWRVVALIATAIAATAAGIASLDIRSSSTGARAARFVVQLPNGWTSGVTRDPSAVGVPGQQSRTVNLAVSPDGSRLAFVAVGTDGQQLLWVRDIGVLIPRALPGTDGASSPFWSPEGQFIGFFADGKLKTVDVSGESVSTLCEARNNRGGSWGSDNVIVFATLGAPLQRVSTSGGKPGVARSFEKGEEAHVYPLFLPDGRHFLYRAITTDSHRHPVYVATLDSNDRTVILESSGDTRISGNVSYSRDHLLFTSGTTLMGQPFDERRLTTNGDVFPVAENVRGLEEVRPDISYFSASPNGVLAFETGVAEQSELVWYDRRGRQLTKLGDPGIYFDIRLSPRGDLATVTVQEPGKLPDIWIYDAHLGRRTPLTSDASADRVAIWSPTGDRIVFGSGRKGPADLYMKATNDAGGAEALLLEAPGVQVPEDWSPDGRSILFGTSRGTHRDLWLLPLSGDRTPVPVLHGTAKVGTRISPDGRWLAYQSPESGRYEVYVAPFQHAGTTRRISTEGGNIPRWSHDGSELFFIDAAGWLVSAAIDTRTDDFHLGSLRRLFPTRAKIRSYAFDVSPRSDRFLINSLLEENTQSFFTVVLNWTAGLAPRN
jgi:eukaryotic-like serine/threonine-protein kinase